MSFGLWLFWMMLPRMFTYLPLCFHLESCVLPRSKIAELYGKHKVWFKLRFKGNSLSFKRLSGCFPQEKSPITHHQCVSLTNTSYGLFLMVVNYWSNISHLVMIWILLMTNDVEHLCMHFLAIGAPYLLKCVFSHILCSVSSHKTFDYEVTVIHFIHLSSLGTLPFATVSLVFQDPWV